MSVRIFCFDVAIKNIGFCYIEYNGLWIDEMKKFNEELRCLGETASEIASVLNKFDVFLRGIIKVVKCGVYDISGGEKVNMSHVGQVSLAKKLKMLLNQIVGEYGNPDYLLVENQMGPNDIMRVLNGQIIYHFADGEGNVKFGGGSGGGECGGGSEGGEGDDSKKQEVRSNNVKIVVLGSSLKNTISLGTDLQYDKYISKWSKYTANKKHTADNFLEFIERMGLKIEMNKGQKINDISDAFMLSLGFIKKNLMGY
jgi:hypothetical protein